MRHRCPASCRTRSCAAFAGPRPRRWPRAIWIVALAADTMVALDDRLLGKPADEFEAAAMLRLLRGRTHQVYTAVCAAQDGGLVAQLSVSDVTMRPYSDAEIATYVATGIRSRPAPTPFSIPSSCSVAAWTGCYAGIMGLPLRMVGKMLADVGLMVSTDVAIRVQSVEWRKVLVPAVLD